MKWRPIMFHTTLIPMVMDGLKTQTRRLVDLRKLAILLPQAVDRRWLVRESLVVKAGRHLATLSDHGAVSVASPRAGFRLGLKAGEFQFCCPLADGETVLAERDSGKEWTIQPAPDQRLWVKETWSKDALSVYPCPRSWYRADCGMYDDPATGEHSRHCDAGRTGRPIADCFACAMNGRRFRWRSSMFMPRLLSRTSLVVSMVRLQRLQSITEQDAIAEGVVRAESTNYPSHFGFVLGRCKSTLYPTARAAFAAGWDRINSSRKRRVGDSETPGTPALTIHESVTWESNPWVWAYTFTKIEVN